LDDFHPWTILGELLGKPGLGFWIPVDKHDPGGLDLLAGPLEQIFPGSVSSEIEVANFAPDGNVLVVSPVDQASLPGFTKNSRGREGLGVADKKYGIVFPGKKENPSSLATSPRGFHLFLRRESSWLYSTLITIS